jgi:hypothetical protein
MVFKVNANSLDKTIFADDVPIYDGIKVVPSAVMKTTSLDFSLESATNKPLGVYDIDVSINSDDSSKVDINKLKGYFESNVGRHYIELRNTLTIDMSELDDNNDYNLSLELVYNDASIDDGTYPLTEINFNVEKTDDEINGKIFYSFHFEDDTVTEISTIETTTFQISSINHLQIGSIILSSDNVSLPFVGANYCLDTSNNTIDFTLKADPIIGEYYLVTDVMGTFSDNNVNLLRNGNTIMGSDEDYQLDIDSMEYKIIFVGNNDWRVV